jgi:hypothetical protein
VRPEGSPQPASDRPLDEVRNVAVGNAVLAGIAASDAICYIVLGHRHRGQDHQGAVGLLREVPHDGSKLGRDLATILGVKDPAHYGDQFVTDAKLRAHPPGGRSTDLRCRNHRGRRLG